MTALPDRTTVVSELFRAGVVGAALLALGESMAMAAGTAAGFLALRALGDAIQRVVGDYADHVLLGGAILVGVALLARSGIGVSWVVGGALVGGWLLVDGVQQLRYGRTRDQSVAPLVADGNGPIRGFLRALLGRLLAPITLSRTADVSR
ncbi:hypothetical protein [Halonotius roseus]|uniref:Uncharacterized protein n=1 Tax=Halonotius roseus TaxID=2511997 RepID=A0A544QLR9_9EURY|nr:hypothetical protein [Halonotius roseus]TQQ79522.1 hypothetical protein EWF95_10935 [Halonotius roseus]